MNKYFIITNRGESNSGMMQLDEGWGDMPPRWMAYFAVESVDITVDNVRQLGGYVLLRPVDITEGRLAIMADGQGAMFQLVESIQPFRLVLPRSMIRFVSGVGISQPPLVSLRSMVK